MRGWSTWVVLSAAFVSYSADAIAQITAEPGIQGTLPGITVKPPDSGESEDTDGPATFGEPSERDSGATGGGENAADIVDGFDSLVTDRQPSLADQFFGDLGGATHSAQSLFDEPKSATILGERALADRLPADVGQALESTPGVLIQRTGRGQASPFVRGLTGQQVLILVDGIRMSGATFRAGPNQYLSTIDPGQIERIEVVRGPGSVAFGSDAIGGVINIVTKRASFIGFGYGRAGTIQRVSSADSGYYGRITVEAWSGTSGLYAGGGYGNFHDIDRGGDLGRQPATSWNFHSGDVVWTRMLDCDNQLTVSLQHFEAEDVFRTDRFPANRETIFDPQQRDLAMVRFEGDSVCGWFDSYSITGSFHRMKEGRLDRRPTDSLLQDQRAFSDEQVGVNLLFASDLDELGILTYGVDWYHEDIDARRQQVDESVIPPLITHSDQTQFPDDAFYSRYGVFLEWDVLLTDRWSLVTGVRYEFDEAGATVTAGGTTGKIDPQYGDWIGSAALTYEIKPWWHIVGSVSEGFRAPNLDDLSSLNDNVFAGVELPNPSLRPEHALTYEVGTKIDANRLRGQAFVWWTDLENNISRSITNPGPNQLLNRVNRDARLSGVELAGEWLLSDKCCHLTNWSIYGNYWYTLGWDLEADEPLSRIPPMQGNLGLRWRDPCGDWWFDFYGQMVDRQDKLSSRDLTDTIRIPPGGTPGYATVNLRAGCRLGERERLVLNIENLTDKAYRVHGSGSDGTGIHFVLGYELNR